MRAGGQTSTKREDLCESGLPDADVCGVDWDGDLEDPGTRARRSTFAEAWSRGRWLLGLLVLQACTLCACVCYSGCRFADS